MKKYISEFIGTFVLTFIGCGCAAIYGGAGGSALGVLSAALAFGLSLTAMYYVIGNISGCHINPAVTIAVLLQGKIRIKDGIIYIVSQILGALAGAGLLYAIFKCIPNADIATIGLGANGFDTASAVSITMMGALIVEAALTFIFVLTVLGVSSNEKFARIGGVVVGGCLTLVHLLGIALTGTSVNPARSLAPALLLQGTALEQVWVFIVGPIIGAILAALVWKLLTSEKEDMIVEEEIIIEE